MARGGNGRSGSTESQRNGDETEAIGRWRALQIPGSLASCNAFLPSRLAAPDPRLVLDRPRRPRRPGRGPARAPAAVGAVLRPVADPDRGPEERLLRRDDGRPDSVRARLRAPRRTPPARARNPGDRRGLADACRGGRVSGPAARGAGGRARIERAASARVEPGEPRVPGRRTPGRARRVQLRRRRRQGHRSRPARRRHRGRRLADVVVVLRCRDGRRRARGAPVAAASPLRREGAHFAGDPAAGMGHRRPPRLHAASAQSRSSMHRRAADSCCSRRS